MAKEVESFQTNRLVLRGINENDASDIVKFRSEPEVYKYFKSPHKITVQEHLNWYYKSYLFNDDRFDWICMEKDTGKKVGVFGIVIDNDIVELNYLLAPESQGKGYAREALDCLISFALDQKKPRKIVAIIHKDNEPSIRLICQLRFYLESKEGEFLIYSKDGGLM